MLLRMSYRLLFVISALLLALSFGVTNAFAAPGTIDPANTGDDTAVMMDNAFGSVNFKPTNGTPVVVTDTELTGNAWGDVIGWINLNPTNAGVTNTCDGELGGYAWGQNAGWINFAPTNGGVTIDPATGEFDGYAWSQNYGWMEFSCPGAGCVRTDWTCSSGGNTGGGGSTGGSTSTNQNQPTAMCSLNASPSSVNPGGSVTLSWSTNLSGVGSATVVSSATGNVAYPNTTSGSVTVTPNQTTTYLATFAGTGATGTATCSDTVIVDTLVPPPVPPVVPTEPTLPTNPIDPFTPTTPEINPTPSDSSNGTNGNTTSVIPSAGNEFACTGDTCTVDKPLFTLPSIAMPGLRDTAQAVAVAALVGAAIANVPGLIFRLQNLLFAFLGFKKRRRNWGVVYDSVTKQPLDPAYVVLSDLNGNEVASSITDLDGRYGFLVPPGIYTMSAGKTHYTFPSALLAGKQKDELYDNLYFGGEIEIKRGDEVVARNIPMDPTVTDWNEVAKREQKRFAFFTKADIWFHKIVNVLFWVGFALAIFSVAMVPVTFNYVALGLYILLFILNMTGFGGRKYGYVKDGKGNPLAFGIVRIFNSELHREIAHKVINANGKYYAIVPKGKYYVTIEQKNRDNTYTKVFTSGVMDVKNGIIKKDFKVI